MSVDVDILQMVSSPHGLMRITGIRKMKIQAGASDQLARSSSQAVNLLKPNRLGKESAVSFHAR
jgi:hypothetical protein